MPTIADRALSRGGKSGRRPAAMIAPAIIAVPVWLGACAPMQDWPPPATAGANPPRVEPAPSRITSGPITSAPIASGPIVLAPGMTGAPAPPPVPTHTAAPVPPPSRPVPPPAMPAAAVDIPTFAPVSCPPGAVAMWSGPDAAGVPVAICRRLHPQR